MQLQAREISTISDYTELDKDKLKLAYLGDKEATEYLRSVKITDLVEFAMIETGEYREYVIEEILRRYQPFLRVKARASAWHGLDPEDLEQEGRLKIYELIDGKKIDTSRGVDSFIKWCVINRLKNMRRDRHRYILTFDTTDDIETYVGNNPEYVEATAIAREILHNLPKIFSGLSREQYDVLSLYYRGFKYKEIAEELGIPIGTVMSRLHTARKTAKNGNKSSRRMSEEDLEREKQLLRDVSGLEYREDHKGRIVSLDAHKKKKTKDVVVEGGRKTRRNWRKTDPGQYYLKHYDGISRGELFRIDTGLYFALRSRGMLEIIPLKSEIA